ncbi:hypothetical protein [Neorhodopirellula lusitana]|uniref:hypothetical protein n=1 Tax=Neorhodopirellula lusitana TaxID=445327 RepID=UPI0024B66994|nr:hypothetical protein [Neorhodopirellula lusitana]
MNEHVAWDEPDNEEYRVNADLSWGRDENCFVSGLGGATLKRWRAEKSVIEIVDGGKMPREIAMLAGQIRLR